MKVDTFFKHTDLSRNEAEQIVSETLNKCDDGELYLENSKDDTFRSSPFHDRFVHCFKLFIYHL